MDGEDRIYVILQELEPLQGRERQQPPDQREVDAVFAPLGKILLHAPEIREYNER